MEFRNFPLIPNFVCKLNIAKVSKVAHILEKRYNIYHYLRKSTKD